MRIEEIIDDLEGRVSGSSDKEWIAVNCGTVKEIISYLKQSGNGAGVEFVSYDGKWPNLCSGTLVLKINGELKELRYAMCSGGSVQHNGYDDWWTTTGSWTLNLPPDLEPYKEEIERVVNENVEPGCCGGCI